MTKDYIFSSKLLSCVQVTCNSFNLVFACGARPKSSNDLRDFVGKIVAVDSHGSWYVRV